MHESVIETSYVYEVSKFDKFKIVFHNIVKFLGDLFFIFIVGIIIVSLVYGLYTKRNGNQSAVPLVSAYVIISPSMVPTINVQDAVIAYKPNPEHLKKGDIITFRSVDPRYPGLTVTHRIIQVTLDDLGRKSFKTKGDNNTTPDDVAVQKENIYGKVLFVIPWLGYLQFFLTKSYGWLLLVVFPCIFIIIYDILKLSKTIKKSKVTKDILFSDIEILDDVEDSSFLDMHPEQITKDENVLQDNNDDYIAFEDKKLNNEVEEKKYDHENFINFNIVYAFFWIL